MQNIPSNFITTTCGNPVFSRIFIENGIVKYKNFLSDEYTKNFFSTENLENEVQQKLVNIFCGIWENKFSCIQKNSSNESILFKVPLSIKNKYNLVFDQDVMIKYNSKSKKYEFTASAFRNIDDISDTLNSISQFISVESKGKTLREAFSLFLNDINIYLFCRHCGVIVTSDLFYMNETEEKLYTDDGMCHNCMINNIIDCENKNIEEITCSICLEQTKSYFTTHCGHKFHRACLSRLEKKNCPMCRKNINEVVHSLEENFRSSIMDNFSEQLSSSMSELLQTVRVPEEMID